jgi:hypothetical protein
MTFKIGFLMLLFPSALTLLLFAPWPLALPGSCALLVTAAMGIRIPESGPKLAFRWPILALSACAVMLSGAIPPFAENLDWTKHYAIFNLLADNPWPPSTETPLGDGTLRYYLAWYVIPAAAGKALGHFSVPLLAFVWSSIILFFAFTVMFGDLSPARSFFAAVTFLLFSGADVIGQIITHGRELPPLAVHLEWWAGFGELSSSMSSLLWVPQHALAGWLAAALFLRYPTQSVRFAGPLVAVVALWSPFCAVGLTPLAAWATSKTGWRGAVSTENCASVAALIPIGLYLTNGAAQIPIEVVVATASELTLFMLLEFGVIAAVLLLILGPDDRQLLAWCVAFLAVLCFTKVGYASDLLMRGAIPSLATVAWLTARTIMTAPVVRPTKVPLVICLLAGLYTPAGEIYRGFVSPRISDASERRFAQIPEMDAFNLWPQYFVINRTNRP